VAFTPIGTLTPYGAPVLRLQVITNSITTTENDSVKLTTGFIALGTAAALVFGHVTSLVSSQGVGLGSTGIAGAAFGSFAGAYLTASNNQTVAQVKAACNISKETLYTVSATAALGTTTGSNLAGYKINLSTEKTMNEASTLATTLQYNTWGVDPYNTAQLIVNVYQSQVYGV